MGHKDSALRASLPFGPRSLDIMTGGYIDPDNLSRSYEQGRGEECPESFTGWYLCRDRSQPQVLVVKAEIS